MPSGVEFGCCEHLGHGIVVRQHSELGAIQVVQVQFLKHQCESRREVQSLHSRVLELISIVASVSQMLYPVHLPIAMVFVGVS